MSEPIRILHVINQMDCGGAETMIMNLYRNIDRRKIQFDFVVHTKQKGFYDDEIQLLGGKIYSTQRYTVTNLFKYRHWWEDFFEKHTEYLLVHGHINSSAAIYLSVAKKYGRIAIAHSHATRNSKIDAQTLAFRAMAYPIRYVADYFFACSKQAGLDRFGRHVIKSSKFAVLKNGIDRDCFRYDEITRRTIREKYSVKETTVVVGHVGRFVDAKNHEFLLQIYRNFQEKYPDSLLWLVGKGELEGKIKRLAQEYGIQKKVCFMGVTDAVQDFLNGMDLFVFPSLFEGLGIALVEAQATGIPCVVSENIQPEADLGAGLIVQLSLDEQAIDQWTMRMESFLERPRSDCSEYLRRTGFDIRESAEQLQEFYCRLVKQ